MSSVRTDAGNGSSARARTFGSISSIASLSVFDFGREHVFDRIGIRSMTWSSDPAGHTFGGWGIGATVRDYARFGYL